MQQSASTSIEQNLSMAISAGQVENAIWRTGTEELKFRGSTPGFFVPNSIIYIDDGANPPHTGVLDSSFQYEQN